MISTRYLIVGMLQMVALFAFIGCSAAGSHDIDFDDYENQAGIGSTDSNTGGTGGSGGYSLMNTAGLSSNGGRGGVSLVTSTAGIDKACAATSKEAEKIEVPVKVQVTEAEPVVLYFMLDQSMSMQDGVKFPAAENAVTWLVNDPSSANLDISLQYFPLWGGACDTGFGYDSPEVERAHLPDCSSSVTGSLAIHAIPVFGLGNGTPMEGALRGATNYCVNFKRDKTANPDGENCAVVLVTDGQPNSCTINDGPGLAQISQDAYNTSQVMTFTIGMTGADFSVLNQIGQAGHTDCTPADPATTACDVSSGGNTFIDALKLIRKTITKTVTKTVIETKALDCEWNMPQPPKGEKLDLDKVNVQFSPTTLDKDAKIIGRVDSAAVCGTQPGWYYNNPINPTRVVACDATCRDIKAVKGGKISILLGCETVVVIK